MAEHSPPEMVRTSCAEVAAKANHVQICDSGIQAVVDSLEIEKLNGIANHTYDTDLHFVDRGPLTAQYLLVLDAINFCFWPDGDLEYEHLAKGLKATVEADPGAIDAESLAIIDESSASESSPLGRLNDAGDGVRELVRWKRQLPLQDERARLLRELGHGLRERFNGSAADLVAAAGRSAARLVWLVAAHFPGFRDHAVYKGKQVFLYKRAQIWVGDVWGAFGGKGLGDFGDISCLTMFADYRVPVTLKDLGILVYTADVEAKIDNGEPFLPGSEEEVEIRACSVTAVEMLKVRLVSELGLAELNSVLLDWWLWEEGEKKRGERKHHKTLTVNY